jgi:hypothetical protein
MATHLNNPYQPNPNYTKTMCGLWNDAASPTEVVVEGRKPSCKECLEVSTCRTCKEEGYGKGFAPQHKASEGCRSGKRAHCTCDTCF